MCMHACVYAFHQGPAAFANSSHQRRLEASIRLPSLLSSGGRQGVGGKKTMSWDIEEEADGSQS